MTGKRKRSDTFSPHEKLVHKSCLLLHREAKKVRTFMVRKVVQQLKQLGQQLETPVPDAVKQQAHEQKLRSSVQKLEREHAALKTLDLNKLVDNARRQTGLEKPQSTLEGLYEHETGLEGDEESSGSEARGSRAEEDGSQKGTKAIEGNPVGAERRGTGEKKQDTALEEKLMDRVLAHKQIVVVLDAIRQLVKEEEKEMERKHRAQDKRALKRGHQESLVGTTGRSGVAPTSLFLGSLSGRRGVDDKLGMATDGYGMIYGADDDIAEFLGEKKKRKNRPGQVARRMKAIRKEEALKRKEDRAQGVFVPYRDTTGSSSNYGPSERPKKAKLKAKSSKRDQPQSVGDKSRAPSKVVAPQTRHVAAAPATVDIAHPSWLAKQKQKEKEKVSLTAFSGKKITFD
uniref:Bud22 domain-containing protein n=1 Tax=Hyaloperonospora arabidopsidis (strain Emoy2) TaxID=559515 RepID=M4BX03_HYAAE